MPTVAGIDHIYITVSDLNRSKAFYDTVLLQLLEFRKNKFTRDGEPYIRFPLFSVHRAVLVLRDQPFA